MSGRLDMILALGEGYEYVVALRRSPDTSRALTELIGKRAWRLGGPNWAWIPEYPENRVQQLTRVAIYCIRSVPDMVMVRFSDLEVPWHCRTEVAVKYALDHQAYFVEGILRDEPKPLRPY